MAHLIYFINSSLDGFMADENGDLGFSEPDVEVHQFVNDQVRSIGTFVHGRRMHETMQFWDTDDAVSSDEPVMTEFAEIWRDTDKVVVSSTLASVSTPRTSLWSSFEVEAVRELQAGERDIMIGGPTLAAHAFEANLVDEVQLMLAPVVIGGGSPALPRGIHADLQLVEQRRFEAGAVYVRYRVTGA